jgi:NAD(P)-dependent dehydrogenase (short-subunit alcohol dehydrogenase family)
MRISDELRNTTSIVTGASGVLGVEHARALLSLGADVALWDLPQTRLKETQQELIESFPESKIEAQEVDITSELQVAACLDALLDSGFKPSVLINNAALNPAIEAMSNFNTRVEHYDLERWRKEIDVNLTGTFICCKIIGTYFAGQGSGSIINIASDLSVISPDNRLYRIPHVVEGEQPVKPISYSVSKTAVVGLSKYLATYWAEFGVRVNALSPGGVLTNQPTTFIEEIAKRIPLARMADRTEYRAAIQFLSTQDSSYMTGQNLVMDGGRSLW